MPEAKALAPLLTLRGVSIADSRAILIDQLDFRLGASEAAAFVGPPGCGKSLLLRVAAGLERPAAGERQIGASRCGFVFQKGGLISNISVEENLLLPLYYQGLSRSVARERAAAALEDFHLGAVARHLPGQLLNEARLMVQFARAAALAVDLLFLDEPFPQLSRSAFARVEQWLKSRVGAGKLAVMMTSVDREAVPRIPTRYLELGGPGKPAPPNDAKVEAPTP